MRSRTRSMVLSCIAIVALIAAPVSASPGAGTVTGASTSDTCFAGADGTCSGAAAADPAGAFTGSIELNSPDSPLSRSTRYSQALARYTIGFDLEAPTREATISVKLRLEEAEAMWQQDTPEVFGGTTSPDSGAQVLFQLLGHSAPSDCGCGWFIQGSPTVIAAEVTEPQRQRLVVDWPVELSFTATNPFGDGLLPAGHYEVLLRGYALADLVGPGDWGSLTASMTGEIRDISVSIPAVASELALSVSGTGSSRVLTAVLTEAGSGTPIDGRTVSFSGDGESLGSAVTVDGIASIPLERNFRGGSHLFGATFEGDDSYESSTGELRT